MVNMYVIKRNNDVESLSFDKITERINNLVNIRPKLNNINIHTIVKEVISKIFDKIPTTSLDELSSEICVALCTTDLEYLELGSRIIISNNHKNTEISFLLKMEELYTQNHLSDQFINIVRKNKESIENTIDYNRDYNFGYFSFKTLEKGYLNKINGKIIERIQDLFMRVSIGIHLDNIDDALETYQFMSNKYFIHATPTLFHAGSKLPQLLSCFLGGMEDSVDGIYKCLNNCAQISKWAGGVGLNIHNIRSKNSLIRGTNGKSNGIVPMLKLFNDTARFINQSGRRQGSFAIYIEPWHADIEDFIELRKNYGDDTMRTRDLFLGLWIPDLFMKCVRDDKDWYLFNPDDCNLHDVIGDEFTEKYNKYVSENKFIKKIKARYLWTKILNSQIETGLPYLLYKDSCNLKSNQKNLGVIKGSNLCTEIIEYHDHNEFACCTLASIGLPKFVKNGVFDFELLGKITRIITRNLNKVIDINYYPIPETELSNKKHRPIGIGVQGLADVYVLMKFPFDSEEAAKLNRDIFETIYYFACDESANIAINREGKIIELNKQLHLLDSRYTLPSIVSDAKNKSDILYKELNTIPEELNRSSHFGSYSSFIGSPISKGMFQFDLWNHTPSERYDWNILRTKIVKYGIRNSLLVAPMPTASTSQILGNNECIEPFTSNIYVRNTLAGNFIVINKYLIKDLMKIGIWDEDVKNEIIKHDGSIQKIEKIPLELRNLYKTSWDISQKVLINQSADRARFVCQSQSLNLFIKEPTINKLSSMHLYSWSKGLKTGLYYLRSLSKAKTQQFTIEPAACDMCSS